MLLPPARPPRRGRRQAVVVHGPVVAVEERHRAARASVLVLRGAWRRVYVITALLALYFNVFVLVVQSFAKVPALKALAPKQTEPPFVAAQGFLLALFVVLTVVAAVRFREKPLSPP
jgi:hypothetical protein